MVTKYARIGQISWSDVSKAIELADQLVMTELSGETMQDLANASKYYGCSGYDAAFIYWAKELELQLITSDKRLLAAVQDERVAIDLLKFVESL